MFLYKRFSYKSLDEKQNNFATRCFNISSSNTSIKVVISNGRTISISLDDDDTQSHFMDQQIYGIVKEIKNV